MDNKGESRLNAIIEIGVGLLMVAILIPISLTVLAQSKANMTIAGVDPTVLTVLLILVPVLAAIGIALYFLPSIRNKF